VGREAEKQATLRNVARLAERWMRKCRECQICGYDYQL